MTEASMHQQQIRLGLRINALAATPNGSTNTGVTVWAGAGAPVASNPASRFANSTWVTITSLATLGTEFKFTRKGIYMFDVCVPLTASEVAPIMIAGSLNAPSLLVAGVTPALAVVNFEDYAIAQQIADVQVSLKLNFSVNVTNAGRSSNTYATTAPVGTSQLGTARIHISDGAGGAPAAVSVNVAAASLRLNDVAELFG